MTDRSHLQRTPITDRTGKQTTVYRKPEAALSPRATLPAPAVTAPAPVDEQGESYAERLAEIEEANDMWRRGLHGDIDDIGLRALGSVGVLMRAAAQGGSTEGRRLASAIEDATHDTEYAQLLIAQQFGAISALMRRDRKKPKMPDARRRKDCAATPGPLLDAQSLTMTIDVANCLNDADLLALDTVPEPDDQRFAAHLWLCATETVSYDYPDEDETAFIRLVDERPEQAEKVKDLIQRGLTPAAVSELLAGNTIAPLADGAL